MRNLTDQEMAVIEHLAAAFNLFIRLPVKHPQHAEEFSHAIHEAQHIVMARPVTDTWFGGEEQDEIIRGPDGTEIRKSQ